MEKGQVFRTDDRIDLGADIGAQQMDGRRGGTQAYTVAAALTDDLGFLERQLLGRGHDDAVAGLLYLIERAVQTFIALPDSGKIAQNGNEVGGVRDMHAGLLLHDAVENTLRDFYANACRAAAEIELLRCGGCDILAYR